MKKTLFVLIGLLNISGLIYSQFNTFNLSEFKLPDIRRNQLDISVSNEFRQYASLQESEYDTTKRNSTSFSDNSELTYISFTNTQKYQGNRFLSFGLRPVWSSNKQNEESRKESHFDPYFSLGTTNRFYNPNKYFFDIGLNAWGSQYSDKTTVDVNHYSEKSKESYIGIAIPVSAGYGRIEPIQEARLAVYILEELQKAGKLAMVPNNGDITEFASFIALLKNERYFDYRLRRMEEIEKVDSFMHARGWVNKADARYYTTVYDNWEYADGPVRESGKRLSAGLKPYFEMHTDIDRTDENNSAAVNTMNRNSCTGMEFFVVYVYEKPINLHWQSGWSAKISYATDKNHHVYKDKIADSESTGSYLNQIISGNARYAVGYFPNSRTSLNANININAYNNKYSKSEEMDIKNRFVIYPGISLQLEYYISERSGLIFRYTASYNSQKTDYFSTDYENKMNDFGHFAHVNFKYKIF